MTKFPLTNLTLKGLLVLLAALPLASRAGEPLIVVEDRGGTSEPAGRHTYPRLGQAGERRSGARAQRWHHAQP